MVIVYNQNLGKDHGKPDTERLGIFVEMPYLVGAGFKKTPHSLPKLAFLGTGRKSKNGTQHGYFDNEFRRLFVGDYNKRKREKGPINSPFIVGYGGRKHSTPGDQHGTFSGRIDHFSNVRNKKPPYVSPGINFLTNNGKKGGPGVLNTTINKFPNYISSPYTPKLKPKSYGAQLNGPFITAHYTKPLFEINPFYEGTPKNAIYVKRPQKEYGKLLDGPHIPTGPAKWQGGCHAGCFDKFPQHMPSKYVSMIDANKPFINSKGAVFYPQSTAEKTMFTTSILSYNTNFRVNSTNYKTYESTYVKYLTN